MLFRKHTTSKQLELEWIQIGFTQLLGRWALGDLDTWTRDHLVTWTFGNLITMMFSVCTRLECVNGDASLSTKQRQRPLRSSTLSPNSANGRLARVIVGCGCSSFELRGDIV